LMGVALFLDFAMITLGQKVAAHNKP
jgi:hypothetical protein